MFDHSLQASLDVDECETTLGVPLCDSRMSEVETRSVVQQSQEHCPVP